MDPPAPSIHEARRDAAPGRRAPLPRVAAAHTAAVGVHKTAAAQSASPGPSEPTRRTSLQASGRTERLAGRRGSQDAFASLAVATVATVATAREQTRSSYVFDFNDPSLVRALASLVHARGAGSPGSPLGRVSAAPRVVRDAVSGPGGTRLRRFGRRRLLCAAR